MSGVKRKTNGGDSGLVIPKKAAKSTDESSLLASYDMKPPANVPSKPQPTASAKAPKSARNDAPPRKPANALTTSPNGMDITVVSHSLPVSSVNTNVTSSTNATSIAQPPAKRPSRDLDSMVWNSLSKLCVGLAESENDNYTLKEKSSGSAGALIDLSGSMLERSEFDWYDTDQNGNIVVQPKIPIFPEDFPPGKPEWPLSWWGIVDPSVEENGKGASPPSTKGRDGKEKSKERRRESNDSSRKSRETPDSKKSRRRSGSREGSKRRSESRDGERERYGRDKRRDDHALPPPPPVRDEEMTRRPSIDRAAQIPADQQVSRRSRSREGSRRRSRSRDVERERHGRVHGRDDHGHPPPPFRDDEMRRRPSMDRAAPILADYHDGPPRDRYHPDVREPPRLVDSRRRFPGDREPSPPRYRDSNRRSRSRHDDREFDREERGRRERGEMPRERRPPVDGMPPPPPPQDDHYGPGPGPDRARPREDRDRPIDDRGRYNEKERSRGDRRRFDVRDRDRSLDDRRRLDDLDRRGEDRRRHDDRDRLGEDRRRPDNKDPLVDERHMLDERRRPEDDRRRHGDRERRRSEDRNRAVADRDSRRYGDRDRDYGSRDRRDRRMDEPNPYGPAEDHYIDNRGPPRLDDRRRSEVGRPRNRDHYRRDDDRHSRRRDDREPRYARDELDSHRPRHGRPTDIKRPRDGDDNAKR
ncbi:unnamed protein product [Cylindrotheca closterium]|uniref:Uncharacterized protein n=1 Tax=Cylindrotheca closterium TaxID=2856 RepID=A0AAD2FRJ9_9STRA|nr:unnamed protein product [Cylindrotheca closterium]